MNATKERLGQPLFERRWYSRYDKLEVLKRTKGRCAACGKKLKVPSIDKEHEKHPDVENMTIDHIIPIDRGGTDSLRNMLPLCYDCNQKKGNTIYIPDWYYTAIIGSPAAHDATEYFSSWFKEYIRDKFHIEQYPLVAPRNNLMLEAEMGTSFKGRSKKKIPYIPGSILSWEYMGKTKKEEVLAVTGISLYEMKRVLCNVLEDTICGQRDKKRLMAVYTCRKKTTDKILTATGIVYDREKNAAAIYFPWMDLPNAYRARIAWSFVLTLHGALSTCGYGLADIALIMPWDWHTVIDEISDYLVWQLSYMKQMTHHGYKSIVEEDGESRYILLRISEQIAAVDKLIDSFRDSFRTKMQ